MSMVSQTSRTSAQSLSLVQTPFSSYSSQFFMNTPMTSCPCCLSSRAATDESTPPDIPTTILAMVPPLHRKGIQPRINGVEHGARHILNGHGRIHTDHAVHILAAKERFKRLIRALKEALFLAFQPVRLGHAQPALQRLLGRHTQVYRCIRHGIA